MSDPMPETINMSFKARRALFESKKNGNSSREDSVGGAALTGGQNKPLTCLSVNVTNVRHEIDQKDVKFLKQEISDLQKRITKLDATKNKDLLELMKSKNQESEEKEEHLKQLNEKLLQIQTGLREIESERQQLIKKAKALEDEKMELKEQLRLRDKEIQSLTKRCSSHTDDRKKTESYVEKLELELKTCHSARSELESNLATLTMDYENVCENLVRCLGNVKAMGLEKVAWEHERRRLQQNVQLELEQQRLSHVQTTLQLQQEVQSREKKVAELEKTLQNKNLSIKFLRESMGTLELSKKKETRKLISDYELKLLEMTKAHDFQMQDTQSQINSKCAENEKLRADFTFITKENLTLRNDLIRKSQTIEDQQEEIIRKSSEIDCLREDIALRTNEIKLLSTEIQVLREEMSTQMQQLMTVTAELQKLQEECKMVDALVQDVEALEQDRYSLRETLHEKNTAIAELEAEILKLEIEKELALQDSERVMSLREQLDEAGECALKVQRLEQKLLEMDKDRNFLETMLQENISRARATEFEITSLQAINMKLKDQLHETQNAFDATTNILELRELALRESKAMLQEKQNAFDSEVTLLQNKAEEFVVRTENENEIFLEEKYQLLLQASKESERKFQDSLEASEQKIIAKEEQICLLENKLFENAQKNSKVEKDNLELAAKLQALETDQLKAKEALSLLTVQLQDKEHELKRQHVDWQKKEDAYLEKIHKESHQRELCEFDLCQTRTKLDKIRIEYKDCVELEKQNKALKDKIRRQEAYLRRKIEQEKFIRDRLPGNAVKANQVKISGRINKNAALPHGKGLSTSKATLSTVSDSDSLDWELDELLAD